MTCQTDEARNAYEIAISNLMGEDLLGDLGVNGRSILKRILEKLGSKL